MKIETMSRALIVIGALVMLYARKAMPIALSGADVVNIQLMSERQNTLMLGGLIFFAGIVLFAVFKMKQTKEDAEREEKQQQVRVERTKAAIQNTSEGAIHATKSMLDQLESGKLSIAVRLIGGVVCGGILAFNLPSVVLLSIPTLTDPDFRTIWIAIGTAAFVAAIAYAFLGAGTKKTVMRLVVIAVISVVAHQAIQWDVSSVREDCFNDAVLTDHCREIRFGTNRDGSR